MWDVGGQKSLRSYWRNYFECTDGLIWVVDSADKRRLNDCKDELHQLLQEEVSNVGIINGYKIDVLYLSEIYCCELFISGLLILELMTKIIIPGE